MLEHIMAGIYMLLAVFILTGNSLTIAAIYKTPKLDTASNQFIFGLAIADLLVGLGIPYDALMHLIPFENTESYETFALKCLVSKIPLFLSCTVSVGHLVIISIDRYISLVRPLQHKVFLTKRKAWQIMAILWIGSTLAAVVPVGLNRYDLDEKIGCMLRTITPGYYAFAIAPTYLLFLMIMLVTYIGIFKIASSHTDNTKKPIKVIGIIVGCFVVCWTPFMILLGFVIDAKTDSNSMLRLMFTLSLVLTGLNSMVNPLIYVWKINDFRMAFLKIIRSACRCENKEFVVASNGQITSRV